MKHDGFIRAEANDLCRFKVRGSNGQVKLSKMFALIEDVKTKMLPRSQTTLEQIFISFASQQEEHSWGAGKTTLMQPSSDAKLDGLLMDIHSESPTTNHSRGSRQFQSMSTLLL
ncbi:hypothetical protein JG688_00004737 [Phytophthora aleatoria]|uniref:Uncharacterized protein n=1 Tax=Phytophthora aleatoria TaxID=2496075 RepID=A0A8J5INZ0_9STRA|nr:hypothetical protein JG688_00004737 [Phytophthora aleatoria]